MIRMKEKIFSQSVIDEYIQKIQNATSLDQLHDFFASSKDWLEWLVSKKAINSTIFHELRRELVREVEQRSHKLNGSQVTKKNRKIPILIVFVAILVGTVAFLFSDFSYIFNSSVKDDSPQVPDKRIIPFRGILKGKDGTAIDSKQDVYFTIYSSPIDGSSLFSGSCVGENGIVPEYNGSFTVTLGSDCGMKPISESIFISHSSLYLGVKIGSEGEIKPRYKISTSGYSRDTALLGGLPAGKTNSSIPYIDQEGSVVIDSESPSIRSTQGVFTIEGQTLVFQTNEQIPGDILFQPGIGGNTSVSSGNFGVGNLTPDRKLSVVGLEPYSSIASIQNLAIVDEVGTSVLDLTLATDPNGSKATFVNFYSGSTNDSIGKRVGSIRLNKGAVVYETTGADIAEYFSVEDGVDFEVGTIITLVQNGVHAGQEDEPVVGVVTDSAGYIGNAGQHTSAVLVGLLGQIEVFVSDINGEIRTGDTIGASIIPGYGAKSNANSEIVGYALENMDAEEKFTQNNCPSGLNNKKINNKMIRCGKLKMLLRPE